MSASSIVAIGEADGPDRLAINSDGTIGVSGPSGEALGVVASITGTGRTVDASAGMDDIGGNSLFVTTGSFVAHTSLATATTGVGTTADFGAGRANISAFILVNGTVTGGTVALEVSHDDTNWARYPADLVTGTLGTGVNAVLCSVNGAFRYARAVVRSNITGGGSVTVSITCA